MRRRGFLGALLGLIGLGAGAKAIAAQPKNIGAGNMLTIGPGYQYFVRSFVDEIGPTYLPPLKVLTVEPEWLWPEAK